MSETKDLEIYLHGDIDSIIEVQETVMKELKIAKKDKIVIEHQEDVLTLLKAVRTIGINCNEN